GYGPFFLVPLAGVFAALLAVGIGWVALRTRAATFVIVTIAFMFMLQLLAENLVKLTGGGAGLSLPYPRDWGGDFFNTPFYYAMLALAALALLVSWSIRRSNFGLGLLAIRDDEDKALAVGVPTRTFQLGALLLEPAQLQFAYHFGASRLYLVFYSAVFLVVILLLPRGIVPSVAGLLDRWRRRGAAGPTATARGTRKAVKAASP